MSRPVQHSVSDDHPDAPDAHHRRNHDRRHLHGSAAHHDHRGIPEQPHPDAAPRGHERRAGAFTLQHGSRRVRIGPVAFWITVGTLVSMAAWSVTTATYFTFQDDVVAQMAARQAEMQASYEDRLAEMRAQVDRATSRQLLDQEQLEQKLELITRRQSVLEQRATTLGTVADPTGAVRGNQKGAPSLLAPKPMSGPALFAVPGMRGARLDRGADSPPRSRAADMQRVVARVMESLDRIEGRQTNTLAAMEEGIDAKARRLRAMLSDVGFGSHKGGDPAVGGPFVAYRLASTATPFERQVYRINVARAQVERMNSTLNAVPLHKPVEGEIETSSGFGVRVDPFNSRAAMHTGIDFRGDSGDPVHVTASGTVVSAGWTGGYGRMIEIDHGNGLATRYGHLSEIDVHVGQTVKVGQAIGRIGSTGRSTGPHLHYETRVDGEAVDPQKFLRAGAKFGLL